MSCLVGWAVVLTAAEGRADQKSGPLRQLPDRVELADQYERTHRWEFPHTNVVLLTIADRDGADQVDGWVEALKTRYQGRVEWRGLAQVEGVPGFWKGRVRRKFQETRRFPVLLDWSGAVCREHGYEPKVANLLVVKPDGTVEHRVAGPADTAAVSAACAAIDRALAGSSAAPKRKGMAGAGNPGAVGDSDSNVTMPPGVAGTGRVAPAHGKAAP